MHAPNSKPRAHPMRAYAMSDRFLRASRLIALGLAAAIALLVTTDSGAKASEKAAEDQLGQTSIAGEAETGPEKSDPGAPDAALGDYRLAPGDRLTIVVFDEPQLSGDFFVDGGGEVLLPLAGSVRVSGPRDIE
jgi:polysaccharide export outer membrane protein